jgi:replicative DNA helicase
MMTIEKTILRNLLKNDQFTRKSLPFLKDEYFFEEDDRILFSTVRDFVLKYNTNPTVEALNIDISSKSGIQDKVLREIESTLAEIKSARDDKEPNLQWLVDHTEQFCQDKSLYNAIMKSIEIMKDEKGNTSKGAIPKILSDALSVSFDPNVGHDYLEQYEDRYEYYHRVQEKLAFDLEYMNLITKGGLPKKTLNIILATTGAGKSLFMCHCAAACLTMGKNVLYITLELAEEEVARRIDANLMNTSFDDLMVLNKEMYMKKVTNLKSKTDGKLIIKEYPTASANALHFKTLLNELYLKKNFKPDIIFVDYMNICCSSRVKPGANINSYTYVKSIAEELRGLAVEFEVPLVTATQSNRTGHDNSDVDLTNTSESFGVPATADFMFALITSEELEQLGQIQVKQLKNRFSDPSQNKRFVLGIDKSKMKLFDVEESAQRDIVDSGQSRPVMDHKNKFKNIKV